MPCRGTPAVKFFPPLFGHIPENPERPTRERMDCKLILPCEEHADSRVELAAAILLICTVLPGGARSADPTPTIELCPRLHG
jgi:hypothetical protein